MRTLLAMLRAEMDPGMLSKYSSKFVIGGKILIFKLTWPICKNENKIVRKFSRVKSDWNCQRASTRKRDRTGKNKRRTSQSQQFTQKIEKIGESGQS